MSTSRLKLLATIDAKRLSRLGIDAAYDQLDKLEKMLPKLYGDKKIRVQYTIEILKNELEKTEDNAINMVHGGNIEGGQGYDGGGGSGCDAG